MLFIPKEGKETLEVNLKKERTRRGLAIKTWVRESVMQREGIILWFLSKGCGFILCCLPKKKGLNENDSRGCRIHCIRISSEYENQSLRSSATYGLKRSVLGKTSGLMPMYLIWNEN